MLFQQGDVLIELVKKIPKGAEKIKPKEGKFVLAEGEATGHTHTVVAEPEISFYRHGGKLYLENSKEIEIQHQEHNTIKIPAGDYIVRGVQEYDHFAEEAKRVQD